MPLGALLPPGVWPGGYARGGGGGGVPVLGGMPVGVMPLRSAFKYALGCRVLCLLGVWLGGLRAYA